MKYKVSGAIAIPKASWGCAPALPNRFRVVSLEAIFRTFHVKHSQDAHSTSFEKTVETSMVLVSTPCFIEKIHKPFDRLNFNKRWLKTNE